MTRRYCQEIDDGVVKRLFQCMMSDEQIGERTGLKPAAVRAARQRMNLGTPRGRPPEPRPDEPPAPRSIDLSNPMALAFLTFGIRLKEVNGAYRLDGTPIRFFDLMKETNRVRANLGQEQFGHTTWRVP